MTETKEIIVETFIDPDQIKKDLAFSDTDLQSAMMNQASMFAYYATQAAKAQNQADRLKTLLEVVESRMAQTIRDRAAVAGEKITEAKIVQQVTSSAVITKHKTAYNNARAQAELGKNMLEAWKQRRDMLVQIGISQREEAKGSLRISGSQDQLERAKKLMEQ